MKRIDWKAVGRFIGHVGEGVLYAFGIAALYKYSGSIGAVYNFTPTAANYSEAVEAIMNSDMGSYYKSEAVDALKQTNDAEYYRAIAHIANDENTASYYRVEMIKKLGK